MGSHLQLPRVATTDIRATRSCSSTSTSFSLLKKTINHDGGVDQKEKVYNFIQASNPSPTSPFFPKVPTLNTRGSGPTAWRAAPRSLAASVTQTRGIQAIGLAEPLAAVVQE